MSGTCQLLVPIPDQDNEYLEADQFYDQYILYPENIRIYNYLHLCMFYTKNTDITTKENWES